MPHSGAYSTFWNLKGDKPIEFPPADYGPLLNFVAVPRMASSTPAPAHWSIEGIAPADLCQPDLHAAMLARRR
jgi:hypothetical protein